MDKLKGWKTFAFNAIMGIIALVKVISPDTELPGQEAVQAVIGSSDAAIVAIVAVGNVILRAVTNSPIFKKGAE